MFLFALIPSAWCEDKTSQNRVDKTAHTVSIGFGEFCPAGFSRPIVGVFVSVIFALGIFIRYPCVFFAQPIEVNKASSSFHHLHD